MDAFEIHRTVLTFSVKSNLLNFSIVISACHVCTLSSSLDRGKNRRAVVSFFSSLFFCSLDFYHLSRDLIHVILIYNNDPRSMKNERNITQGFSFEEARIKNESNQEVFFIKFVNSRFSIYTKLFQNKMLNILENK